MHLSGDCPTTLPGAMDIPLLVVVVVVVVVMVVVVVCGDVNKREGDLVEGRRERKEGDKNLFFLWSIGYVW